jgi:hypothetical protein
MKIQLRMPNILSFDQYLFESNANAFDPLINSFYNSIKSTQVEESPRGSNKGANIEPLQKGVGANPGDPWCAAFVHGVLIKSAFSNGIKNQIPKDAAVRYHWANSEGKKIEYKPNMNINSILPGMVFFYLTKDKKTGGYPGSGHTGIILSVNNVDKTWTAVEGNANPLDGSSEGYGTFIVTRKLSDPSISKNPKDHPAKLLGFIDYFAPYRNTSGFTKSLTLKLKSLTNELLPKTNKEIAYLKAKPNVLKDYEQNYNNRNKL